LAYLHTFADLAPWHAFEYLHTFADLGMPLNTFTPLRILHLGMPWHTFAPLRTLAPLHTFEPLRTFACLGILLVETTKGTPGGALFKLLLASSLLIYIPLLCLPSILAPFFVIPT
jgi:hypothetical protein